VKATVARYDELLRDAYQRQNMSFMREVATEDQTQRLYHHMAALAEGNLRMSSTLHDLRFEKVELPAPGQATVETREVWDFTHHRVATGEVFAEEKAFVYRLRYALRKEGDRWKVENVDVLSGEPTNTVVPWPEVDRSGNPRRPAPPAPAPAPAPSPPPPR
jgi:hypothetical protein